MYTLIVSSRPFFHLIANETPNIFHWKLLNFLITESQKEQATQLQMTVIECTSIKDVIEAKSKYPPKSIDCSQIKPSDEGSFECDRTLNITVTKLMEGLDGVLSDAVVHNGINRCAEWGFPKSITYHLSSPPPSKRSGDNKATDDQINAFYKLKFI